MDDGDTRPGRVVVAADTPADVAGSGEIELKIALAEIVDETEVRGTVARPLHRAA